MGRVAVTRLNDVFVGGTEEVGSPTDAFSFGDSVLGVTEAYPNKPAGMSLIGYSDGTVIQDGNGAFGMGIFGNWSNGTDNKTIVDDSGNPNGSGKALRLYFPSGAGAHAGTATVNTFSGGPYDEIYIMLRVYFESTYNFGSKLFYQGAVTGSRNNTGSPTQYWFEQQSSGPKYLRQLEQNVSGQNDIRIDSWRGGAGTLPVSLETWHNLELHLVSQSAVGVADGEAYGWCDGVLWDSDTVTKWVADDDPDVGFDGCQYYATLNSSPQNAYYRIGEFTIYGK